MSENRLNYSELCPTCLDNGAERNLFLDMDTVQIRCEMNHQFDELPSDVALRNAQPGTVPAPEVTEVTQAEGQLSDSGTVNTLEGDPEQIGIPDSDVAKLAEIASKLPPARPAMSAPLDEDVTVSATQEQVLRQAVRLETADGEEQVLVASGGAVALSNGDILLGVQIPETWRSAVEAEAQAQLKSPAAYFADWLTSPEMQAAIVDALISYWTSSYAQTV